MGSLGPLMRIPPSLKLIAGMWIAALLGALAGRSLAETSSAPPRDIAPPTHGAR
jgi:hypothetical protein